MRVGLLSDSWIVRLARFPRKGKVDEFDHLRAFGSQVSLYLDRTNFSSHCVGLYCVE
jgi:hypothetical protein